MLNGIVPLGGTLPTLSPLTCCKSTTLRDGYNIDKPKVTEAGEQRFAKLKQALARAKIGEPVVGIEPTADGLQNRCSTAELHRLTS